MNHFDCGYALIDTGLADKIKNIRSEFIRIFDQAARLNGLGGVTSDEDINKLYKSADRDVWVGAYDQLRHLPEIFGLVNEPILLDEAKRWGIRFPAVSNRVIVRADMPFDDSWAFPPHQDYHYNLGSLNSITVWIPLQDIDDAIGPLSVISGTHHQGHQPQKNGTLLDYDESKAMDVKVTTNQALVFSQFLFHRSGMNRSDRVRFSMQIRYNDLGSKEYAKRRFMINKDSNASRDPDFETYYPRNGDDG